MCRTRHQAIELPTYIQPDGTPWRPDLNGVPWTRLVHY
jgi:hypothetical protein